MDSPFSQEMREMIGFYDEHYHLSTPVCLNTGHKLYLGNKNNRECRFCGTTDQSLFKMEAHAFPEFIGNRELISNYECDICNERFSRTIEDHLAKYTLLERTVTQVRGKKGVPSFKSPSKRSRIDVVNKHMDMVYHPDDGLIHLDIEKQNVGVHAFRQPYIPRSAFKCLVKMAVSILPENELQNFVKTIKWLNIEKPSDDPVKSQGFTSIYSFTPGPKPFPCITAILLRRKSDTADLPYMIFFVAFSSFTFQIAIPLSDKDVHLAGKELTLPAFPNVYHDGTPSGRVHYSAINLSSNELVCNESNHMYIHFSSIRNGPTETK